MSELEGHIRRNPMPRPAQCTAFNAPYACCASAPTVRVNLVGGGRMKRIGSVVLKSLVFLAIVNLDFVNAQAQNAPQPVAEVGEKTDSSTRHFTDVPQDFVVCTGWHALCTASPDCKMNGDTADCDCMRVNETHIVATSEIQDTAVKRLTQPNARMSILAM